MRKRILLLPVLVAALLAISVSSASADPIKLILEDLTSGSVASIEIADGSTLDEDPTADRVEVGFLEVGSFLVQIHGYIDPSLPAAGDPFTADLMNLIIYSSAGTDFRATLVRSGLQTPALGGVAGEVQWFANMSVPGSVTFTSYVAGQQVLNDIETVTTGPVSPNEASFGPIDLSGAATYEVKSVLDFHFAEAGSMTANTRLEIQPTGVPEPTTLLMFGPGMLGLLAFGRRVRGKTL